MIKDERIHEFWVGVEHRSDRVVFACGDVLNLTRAHGDSVREALERHLATLEARVRSLTTVLSRVDPDRIQSTLLDVGAVRTSGVIVRPPTMEETFAELCEANSVSERFSLE